MTSASASPHDQFFKELMTQPGVACAFLRERLPEAVTALFTEFEPRLESGSFVDPEFRSHHSDLLFSLDLKSGDPALIYILFEHKSYPDAMVAFQLLRYVIAIWYRYLSGGGGKPLPLIIPMVVYHGAEPWNVPLGFSALFDPEEALAGIVPDFRYFLSDLGAQADHELSRFALLRSGLMALKHATRDADIVSIEAIVTAEIWHDLFCGVVIKYIFKAFRKIDRDEVMRLLTRIEEKAGSVMVSNIAQEWIDEGKALGLLQGVAEGMAQGVAEGMARGEARLLTRQLTRRFGTLPADVTARMEDADTYTLEAWADRLLDARTLDEVFAAEKSSLS
jgi:predicted transposase/invertase (TIGR01784 family)